jgi:spermidine/putrescine-binding protein
MKIASAALRRALGAAVAGVSLMTVTAALAGEVTVWCWDPNFNGATMKEAGDRYAASHPDFKLNIVDFAKADLEQKLQAQLASGTTDGLPDIVLIEDYGAQKYLQSFPGAFEPLSGQVDYAGFAPYKVELATLNGQTYSLPFDSGVTGLFYRSDYLAEAGYSDADLQDITWDQAHRDRQGGEGQDRQSAARIDLNDAGCHPHHAAVGRQAGTSPLTGRPTSPASPVFKAALETYAKLLQATEIYKPVSGWTEYTGAFTSGESAAVFTGVWMTAPIKAAGPGGQVGRRTPAQARRRRGGNARLQPRRLELVRAGLVGRKGRGDRFPQRGLGQGRRLLPEDPRQPGSARFAARGPRWRGLSGQRRLFRRPAGVAELHHLARPDPGRQLRRLHQRGGRRGGGPAAGPRQGRLGRRGDRRRSTLRSSQQIQ